MFVFECAFMPLGGKLGGSKPDRKIDSLIRWFKKLSDYNQNQGNLRELLKQHNKQTL